MFSRRKHIAEEIRDSVVVGLEADWVNIASELMSMRLTLDPDNSRTALTEFTSAWKLVSDVIVSRLRPGLRAAPETF